jgi:hypothetical protein
MRFVCGDVRDLIVSYKNNHGRSYQRYSALHLQRRLKISFCEIFAIVRFSTFATVSANRGLRHRSKQQSYSITSSAVASNVGGTINPNDCAVLRLKMSWNFVGCCSGSSAGFAPLRMRST